MWILFLLTIQNQTHFTKKVTLLSKILKKIRVQENVHVLQARLICFYTCHRPSFWFDLLDAVDQGVLSECLNSKLKFRRLKNIFPFGLTENNLTDRIITTSPFPHDNWIRTTNERTILRPGNRIIICE